MKPYLFGSTTMKTVKRVSPEVLGLDIIILEAYFVLLVHGVDVVLDLTVLLLGGGEDNLKEKPSVLNIRRYQIEYKCCGSGSIRNKKSCEFGSFLLMCIARFFMRIQGMPEPPPPPIPSPKILQLFLKTIFCTVPVPVRI